MTRSSLASAPVCELAAFCPLAVRAALSATIGTPRALAFAAAAASPAGSLTASI